MKLLKVKNLGVAYLVILGLSGSYSQDDIWPAVI